MVFNATPWCPQQGPLLTVTKGSAVKPLLTLKKLRGGLEV